MTSIRWLWLIVLITPAAWGQEVCWQLTPFDDTIRIEVSQPEAGMRFFALPVVSWDGADVYHLDGAGTAMDQDPGVTATITMGFHNSTGFFTNNPAGTLTALISYGTLEGPYSFQFLGPQPPFVGEGHLTLITCPMAGHARGMPEGQDPVLAGAGAE